MSKNYYIGYFVEEEKRDLYSCAVPARLKMGYVIDALQEKNIPTYVFSLATSNKAARSKETALSDAITIRYIASLGRSNRLSKSLSRFLISIQLFFFLLFRVKRDDRVIVYHAYPLLKILSFTHKIKKFKWIAELEEFYSSAWKRPEIKNKEIDLLKNADAYISVNHVIADYFGVGKDVIISHGAYRVPDVEKPNRNDGKIRVVYAGAVDTRKRGALTAAEAARHLNDNYKIDILGFGSDENIENLRSLIKEINEEKGYDAVEYHGTKHEKELSEFLLSCDIGLSSNIMDPDFANHTFPSKAITYVAHDLVVVTGYADIFPRCDISPFLYYFYEYSPEAIAKAILDIDIDKKANGRELIQGLHEKFCDELQKLLQG